ncbi:MBL fold metallo-hydrolase [Opitutus terrae]|uniref:Beta-lactamase domain protein n=1 Tax=Opitutus terrae (strain DSM 11246 / JCM 15787 / PB90-1) TaxID=452637 RepID=B1ZQL3_OPITP|nr:MBL fold metallo-hydrolase [Opitutus terrae]ACB75622.1 beta-lactamase domain protein [Opitutus terrae PB90-1]
MILHPVASRGSFGLAVLNPVPLEDELGDVLEKAMRQMGLTEEALGDRAHVDSSRIRDAIDYRSDLSGAELRRLAAVLRLNEVGLCALGCNQYPLPVLGALPFCVHPLRIPYGIGVTNAYIVTPCGGSRGILFDTGPGIAAMEEVWPDAVRQIEAVFLTHVEAEHTGGLCDLVERFQVSAAYHPVGAVVPCGQPLGEGERKVFGRVQVTAFSTPGHALAHNCYLVESLVAARGRALLISGDLFFAGSVGCAHHCQRQLATNLGRMLQAIPADTVIAPGHGPMTTAENELRYNPFVS